LCAAAQAKEKSRKILLFVRAFRNPTAQLQSAQQLWFETALKGCGAGGCSR